MSAWRQTGVSLIELVVAIVVIGLALTALTVSISASIRGSADPMVQLQASAIAQAYLEEVTLQSFCDPDFDPDGDPATGCPVECTVSACSGACAGAIPVAESRGSFDDVCDYAGLTDAGAHDQSGTAIAGLESYTVRVSVTDQGVQIGGTPALAANAGQSLLIDVRVSHPDADDVVMSVFRANF